MAQLSAVLRSIVGGVSFWCPGCDEAHAITVNPGWTWDGNAEAPTFSPSVLVRSGHYVAPGECWCTYNAAHPGDPSSFRCGQCHSFVKAGQIQFLPDSTHHLAGQTVPLPPWPGAAEEHDAGEGTP